MKKNILIALGLIVLLAAGAAVLKFTKNSNQSSVTNQQKPLADKDWHLPADQQKIYTDKITKAEEYFKSLNPTQANYANEQFNTYVYIGQQYLGLGKLQLARETYEKALLIRPDDEQAIVGLSAVLNEAGEKDQASSLLKGALDRNPQNRGIWIRYIEFQADLGSSAEQIDQLFQQALEKTERHVDIISKYAAFLEKQGDIEGAIKLWQEAIVKYPPNKALYENEINRLKAIKPNK